MEVIRECDIFNDDSAEVIEVEEESRKTNNCKVIEDKVLLHKSNYMA